MQQDKDLVVKRAGTGLGLFAAKPIPKGKRIIESVGPLIPNEKAERSNVKYFFQVSRKWSIDGSPRANTARYINHSCRPNAEPFISRGRVWIWSRRNIKAGEEITYDYGKDYFEGIIERAGCRCEKCASKTKATKDRRALKPHFAFGK